MKSYRRNIILLCVLSINIFSTAIPFAYSCKSSPGRPFFNDPRSSTSEWEVMQVLICFRDQITRETAQQYIQYLHKLEPKIYPYIHESGNHPVRGFSCAYAFEYYKSPSVITNLESLIKQANECFDPEILTKKRIAAEELEKKRRLIAEQEEEKVRKEKERAAEEARRIQQLEEQRKEREELERKRKKESALPLQNNPQQMLHNAIIADSCVDVETAIQEGADINSSIGGMPPLLMAIMLDTHQVINTLIANGVNLNIKYKNEWLVNYTIKKGDLNTALLLVRAGANFSYFIKDKQDLFTYLIRNVEVLVQQQVTCKIYYDLLYELINHGYDLKANYSNTDLENNAWYTALKLERFKPDRMNAIIFLLSPKLPYTPNLNQLFVLPDGTTWTPLLIDLANKAEFFSYLIRAGADINQKAMPEVENGLQSPFSYALSHCKENLRKFASLLFPQCAIDDGIKDLLLGSIDFAEGFSLFIKNGGSPNYTINPANSMPISLLQLAIHYNDVKAVKVLLDAGANPNMSRGPWIGNLSKGLRNDYTPLQAASIKGNSKIIELLIEAEHQSRKTQIK